MHGVRMGPEHVCLAWAVQYASQIITRSHKGEDGHTGWSRAYGRKKLPRKFVRWGEKVLWLEGTKKKVQLDEKWHDGIFLAIRDESEEAIIGTPTGCFLARSINRRTT